MQKRLLFAVMSLALFALPATPAWAQGCSMCRTALESSVEGRALAGSFNYAILFLMGIPYAMFMLAGFLIYRAYRKRALQNLATLEPQSADIPVS